ncbi:MAG TPA: type I-E CRISPR-associated protein Cas5/CasD [Gemmatimonas sp.]|uniref:type I-E CRISPR-associated protein Cas5/CasD n=1 Tax=Gemmatimonas sp. TaxID=1962908 RepID=UPI002EDB2001
MNQFLAFTVHAPLSSWGDIAVGERRGTWEMPSRSATIGLVGAALGVRREDHVTQQELATAFGIGVRMDVAGTTMEDFHTAQSVSRLNMRRSGARTRAAMMAHKDRVTMLSRRAYRCDALFTSMLWLERTSSPWSLSDVKAALQEPKFALYAGRRANVLAWPLFPELLVADSLAAAFALRPPVPQETAALPVLRPKSGWGRLVAYDGNASIPTGMPMGGHRAVRRDQPGDRRTWLFSDRSVEFNELPEVTHP